MKSKHGIRVRRKHLHNWYKSLAGGPVRVWGMALRVCRGKQTVWHCRRTRQQVLPRASLPTSSNRHWLAPKHKSLPHPRGRLASYQYRLSSPSANFARRPRAAAAILFLPAAESFRVRFRGAETVADDWQW